MSFSPEKLLAQLSEYRQSLAGARHIWVGYSGGLDSHALLYALASTNSELTKLIPDVKICALHVHHGLNKAADQWQEHCVTVCQSLSIPLEIVHVDASPAPGESPEAAARNVRYQAFNQVIQNGDCLLTAHHQDDQAETVLLQLLRGSGPRGLAAMPACTEFGNGWHVRPLLNFSRSELENYAQQKGLDWIEDSSNIDTRFDRNFIRHEILPVLKSRWPAAASTISRAAGHSAEASRILDEVAGMDLQEVRLQQSGQLSVSGLKNLSDTRKRNCLRVWLHGQGLPLPTTVQLEHVIHDVLDAAQDATPYVHWQGAEIRRYRDALFAMPPLPGHDATQVIDWDCHQPLSIPGLSGGLRAIPVMGKGLQASRCLKGGIQVRFRRGGELCQPVGRSHTHAVKKLMQEYGVPPWERDRIPMFYLNDRLAGVGKLWVCEGFQAREGEKGLEMDWHD